MALIIFGIIFIIGGAISLICGTSLNNSYEARWNSFWESGRSNPGEIFVTLGTIALVLGFILLIAGIVLYIVGKNKKPAPGDTQSRTEYLNYLKSQGLITENDISQHSPVSSDAWQCPNCGRINQSYVGTCGCGTSKVSAQAVQQTEPPVETQKETQAEQFIDINNTNKKYCTRCGTQLDTTALFCSKCGAKQRGDI